MNKKKTIILTLLFTVATTLFGCNSTTISAKSSDTTAVSNSASDTSDIEFNVVTDTEEIVLDDTSENEIKEDNSTSIVKPTPTTIENPTNNTNTTSTQKEISTNKKNNTVKESEAVKVENIAAEKKEPVTYTSRSGYSLTFPSSWDGKYTVQDTGDKLTVIFKSVEADKIDYTPWMLNVLKLNPNEDSTNIPFGVREFNRFSVGSDEYIAFGPNSVTLNDDIKDYDKYLQMGGLETETVAKSIIVNK